MTSVVPIAEHRPDLSNRISGLPGLAGSSSYRRPAVAPNGGASALAQTDLARISADIAATPLEVIDETLSLTLARVKEMVDLGLIDLTDTVDAIWRGAIGSGLVQQRGSDAVQKILADTFGSADRKDASRDAGASAPGEGGPAGATVSIAGDEIQAEEVVTSKAWPVLKSVAAHGIVGEMGRLATRDSEADPIAVMGTALVWGAATFGRAPAMSVGDTIHHPRLFSALVGSSSRARKGTSIDPVRRFFRAAEQTLGARSTLPFPSGSTLKISAGPLSSGEGLIDAIRDKRDEADTGEVKDKRLLCIEGEFGSVLRACQRQGNTLSTVLRVAWDGWKLAPMTKHDKVSATDPHICIIAHVTGHELRELLTAVDVWNGFANRFLWLAVRRQRIVPFPKPMPDNDVARIGAELATVIERAHRKGEPTTLMMSDTAQSHWVDCYPELTQEHTGILGAVTSRSEAQALRLAMTFALFDGADRVERQHVEAALAFWRFAFDSANYIFGGAEIDPVAQQIIAALGTGSKTQTAINDLFGGHKTSGRLQAVLADLQDRGRITFVKEQTAGRPRGTWELVS